MSEQDRPGPHIRRIVTRHDADGKAVVWLDGPASNHFFPDERLSTTLIWATDATPAEFTGSEDAGKRVMGTAPPPGGTRFSVLEIQPGERLHGRHRTDTIDYIICMSGRIDVDLDDSSVSMQAGDILIQRGTFHNWINRSNQPARLACILVDGIPKRPGSVGAAERAR